MAQSVRTDLITALYCGVSTAHPGKLKTRLLIKERYYWQGISTDIDQFISNCHACRRSKVPRDKTLGLLHPLPILDRSWQYIFIDFKEIPLDKEGKNIVCIFVDQLEKRPISIPCNKTVDI